MRLLPETAEYLKARKIKLDRYQILQIYMAMGGVPQYLKEIEPGYSAVQVIDKLCFTKDGLLNDEFKNPNYSHKLPNAYQSRVILLAGLNIL